jgi:F0F1-type ATP synthase membrane subunit c/vacuolar-type H+-ATPase subunit K
MNTRLEVSVEAFRAALKPEDIRGLQIFYAAIGSGLFIFAMIIFFVYNTNSATSSEVDSSDVELVQMLSIVHVLLALVMYVVAPLREKAVLKKMLSTPAQISSPAEHCFNSIRNALVIRLAMYEGAALFGLVVCFLAVNNYVIFAEPIYWFNAASSIVVIAYISIAIPNQERLTTIFEEKIRKG